MITWDKLVELEPRLTSLLAEAQSIRDDKSKPVFCANSVWYGYHLHDGGLREKVIQLVGWEAQRKGVPELRTQAAYDVAYQHVYDALPPCRNCLCM